MKRLIALTIIASISLSCPCYAYPTYSAETAKLMKEAGLNTDYDVDAIMERQEALKNGQANNTTPAVGNGQEKAQSRVRKNIKTKNDEYRVFGSADKSVKVTDTEDELHIYSDTYGQNRSYGAKYSYDEFHTAPYDVKANDGHDESTWGELHINENYRQNVYYEPERDKYRLGIDEYRLPWQMN